MEKRKKLNIIFEDKNILVVEKPPGQIIIPDETHRLGTLLEDLLNLFPELEKVNERAGILHRLDKDTSGLILVARNKKSFEFLKKSFKERKIKKKYLALVVGKIKNNQGIIETLIARDPKDRKRQRAFLMHEPQSKRKGMRRAITEYRVLKILSDEENNYTLVEVFPETGRKHQIRVHFAHLGHPVAGDKIYGFKRQPTPRGLARQFLHASDLKVKLPSGQMKEFHLPLTEDLEKVLDKLSNA